MASQLLMCSATEWSKLDPNQTTSTYVQNLIAQAEDDNDASKELDKLFNTKRIEFGTAGLRARMQPGPSGMNDLIVIQTAQGLAKYVDANNNTSSSIKAVVGYDHRSTSKFNLSSKQFAIYTKLVFEQAGIECILLDGYIATPILAFAVRHLQCAVGIMITASHNPKYDDGYKVYWNDGCQIRPPVDEDIAQTIIKEENLKPWIDYGAKLQQLKTQSDGQECYGLSNSMQTKQIEDAYFASIKASGLVTDMNNGTTSTTFLPKFAYTAMHGVGTPYAKRSFEVFNLPPFCTIPSQEKPDANFPTVSFPNPEEKGALDEAMAFSIENNCDIVLANDPDADRLGVAEYKKEDGHWTVFTGDQIATLLGCWLWETIGKNSNKPVAMLASTVSSKMLGAVAQAEGFHFEETLTGFKWIGNRVNTLRDEGYRVLLGYEEAIGFACAGVPDKDGISALGVIATLATSLYSNGETLTSHLQNLHDKYGEFVCNNGYYRCDDPAIVKRIMQQMRNSGKYYDRVGEYKVDSIRDLGPPRYDSTTDDKKPKLPDANMITFRFTNGCVAQFRGSGTEPKFKYYIEMRGEPGEKKVDVEMKLSEMSRVILEELLHPAENGLILPSNL